MNGTLAVARYTLVELSRRRILLVFFIIGLLGIVALGVGLKLLYEVASSNTPAFRSGSVDPAAFSHILQLLFLTYLIQALSLFALLIGFAIGMTAIYHDLESGAAVSIFSKPVSRFAFTVGKIGSAVAGMFVVVGLLALEARFVMFLFGGGLENALWGEVLATVANTVVVMLIVLALSTWMNNIVAAIVAFVYTNVVEGVIVTIHRLADVGAIGNDVVKVVFDILYWLVPHPLISSAPSEMARAQISLSGGRASSQALASLPAASGLGEVVWWAFVVVFSCGMVYYAVRRRQV